MNKLESLYSDAKKAATLKLILQADFRTYFDVMFYAINDFPLTLKPFHDTIIKKLQDIVDGKNTIRNLIINVPVGSGKSLLVEYFISWCFCRSVNHMFCYISHSDRLITRLSKETKDIVESPIFNKLFNVQLKKDDRSKVNWSFDGASNRTGLTAGTIGGAITGLDAGNPNKKGFMGALIIDDPIDAGNIKYVSSREGCIESYDEKLSTRRRHPKVPTILIMQRLHINDLSGWAIANEPDDWDILTIPALDEKEESFWEDKFPVKELKQISRVNPFKFQAQYQQKPIAKGGQIIKTEWYNFYDNINKVAITRLFITADTAQKKGEHNDYSVFCVWATDSKNLYLLDMFRDKWEAPELRKTAISVWNKWENGINEIRPNSFYVEDKASGTGLIQDLQRDTGIPVIPVPRTTDKLTRIEDILTYIESGRVYLPFSAEYGPNPALLSESEGFVRDLSHAHDDILDCVCDAINIGIAHGSASIYDSL